MTPTIGLYACVIIMNLFLVAIVRNLWGKTAVLQKFNERLKKLEAEAAKK